ncbi:MAG: alpha/beta hydrolase [Bacteroides sp.]
MIKNLSLVLSAVLLLFCSKLSAQQHVENGKLIAYDQFQSQLIKPRNVAVWLPENYDSNKKYSVLYMHDGQMLFDANSTWNKQEWKADEITSQLQAQKEINDCIIVGIWNITEDRFYDYFPQKALSYISKDKLKTFAKTFEMKRFNADNYLKFLVTELKPFIDQHYATYTDSSHTYIMGSSMGGLISLYAICEYPQIFSKAACLSIHSPMVTTALMNQVDDNAFAPAFCDYLNQHLPQANSCAIYMDYGNKTLDALYTPYQNKIDEIFWNKGWRKPYWTTNYYPGAAHTEIDWANRLAIPLRFLLGK